LQKKDKENERFRFPFLEICLKRSFSYNFSIAHSGSFATFTPGCS
jgi:hypothetical protein